MPNYDGTGPAGQGPRTGRGMGYCKPTKSAYPGGKLGNGLPRGGAYGKPGGGKGLGRGRRRFKSATNSMTRPAGRHGFLGF